ncbi:MAG: hypothetical protein R6V00_01735 [Candidatus Aminicenantes bacterium]
MVQQKIRALVVIFLFALLILPNTARADKAEMSLLKTKAKNNHQASFRQTHRNRSGIEVGLRLMGGSFWLMRNDINDHLQGINDYYSDNPYSSIDSEFEPIKMGMDFSGEILINFTPHFGIGIGSGYITAKKESTADAFFGMYGEEATAYPKFSAIPITLSLYLGIPIGNAMKIMFDAGGGYYMGSVDWEYNVINNVGHEYEETWNAASNTMGFHGGIHFEFGFTQNSAFVIGAKGRYAKFTDITGDLEYESRTSLTTVSGTIEDATLWYGAWHRGGEEYPGILISDDGGSSWTWIYERKGEVNLSGIVFQAGLKLTF